MTPAKLLIAQRLLESAHELRAIVALMGEYTRDDIAWAHVARELAAAADTSQWLANEIRAER